MELFLIDAISPFFRNHPGKRINWSKIPFAEIDSSPTTWLGIRDDIHTFCKNVANLGYNAVSLDDVAHLYLHPMHSHATRERIQFLRQEFRELFHIIRSYNLEIYLTVDAVPMTQELADHFCDDRDAIDLYFQKMIASTLDDFPEIKGIILRIGESDGRDVKDPLRSHLHIKSASHANALLHRLHGEFSKRQRTLIFRTWTVGAYGIGDLIWHRDTMERTLQGLGGPHFIVSMKPGESDFFRYLPLNKAFFRLPQQKLLELQARREYEGAGEYPSFIYQDCLAYREALASASNMIGISVWCQTGGWHRFRRLTFLESDGSDIWIRANVIAAIRIFRYRDSLAQSSNAWLPNQATQAEEIVRLCDQLIEKGLYIRNYASEKRFFRRLRLPPLLHTYWDSVYVHPFMRILKQQFINDPTSVINDTASLKEIFPLLKELCSEIGYDGDDIDHMEDLWHILHLVRKYYFSEDSEAALTKVREAKRMYKISWPAPRRMRYRIKTEFPQRTPPPRLVKWFARIFLRNKRGYRIFDHIVTIHGLAWIFRATSGQTRKSTPKALRKLAMGIDALFH